MTDEESPRPTAASATPSARALRTMAVVRWVLLALVASGAAVTWWTLVIDAETPDMGEPRYYCPMHPEITSHDPGSCPICFMTLEPIPDDFGRVAAPDHGAVAAFDDEAGTTPAGTAPVMLTTERRQASGIAVTTVERGGTGGEVRWPATLESLEGTRAEVRVRTEAFVERVLVGESGVHVRRGQTLAWVYAPEILRAEEELLAAHRWDGTSHEPGATGGRLIEAAAQRLELLGVTRGEIEAIVSSGETRRRIPLRSPITGTVMRFSATVGTRASPDTVLYEITNHESVRVVATVFSPSELALAGGGAAFFLARGSTERVALTLELIEPHLDDSSRGARARFLAENHAGALRPGAIGEVVVAAGESSALLVPRDAVIDRGRVRYVFVEVSPGTFEPRVVSVGATRGDEREIVEGLLAGERVVVRGGFVLDSESRLAAALAPRRAATEADAPAGADAPPDATDTAEPEAPHRHGGAP